MRLGSLQCVRGTAERTLGEVAQSRARAAGEMCGYEREGSFGALGGVILEQRQDLLARNLLQLTQACQELEEIEVSIPIARWSCSWRNQVSKRRQIPPSVRAHRWMSRPRRPGL